MFLYFEMLHCHKQNRICKKNAEAIKYNFIKWYFEEKLIFHIF